MHRLVRVDCAGVLSRHMECRNILTRRLCAFIRIALLAMYSAQLPAIATRLSSGRLRRLRRRIAECSFTCITLGAGLELIRVRRKKLRYLRFAITGGRAAKRMGGGSGSASTRAEWARGFCGI